MMSVLSDTPKTNKDLDINKMKESIDELNGITLEESSFRPMNFDEENSNKNQRKHLFLWKQLYKYVQQKEK